MITAMHVSVQLEHPFPQKKMIVPLVEDERNICTSFVHQILHINHGTQFHSTVPHLKLQMSMAKLQMSPPEPARLWW